MGNVTLLDVRILKDNLGVDWTMPSVLYLM